MVLEIVAQPHPSAGFPFLNSQGRQRTQEQWEIRIQTEWERKKGRSRASAGRRGLGQCVCVCVCVCVRACVCVCTCVCVCVGGGAAPLRQRAAGTTLNCGFQLRSPGPAGCGQVGAGRTVCQTHTEGPLRGWQLSPQTPLCLLWPCLPPLVREGPPGSEDSLYVVGSGTEWSDPRYCLLVAEGLRASVC